MSMAQPARADKMKNKQKTHGWRKIHELTLNATMRQK